MKRDIKELPFELIWPAIEQHQADEMESLLQLLRSRIRANNEAKLKSVARQLQLKYGDSEEGSDGFLEEARESTILPDPSTAELDGEAKKECLETAKNVVLEEFIKSTNLDANHGWVIPQMMAYFGREWRVVRREDGIIDCEKTVVKNAKNNFDRGLYLVAMLPRKVIGNPEKTKERWLDLSMYNHLVPIILCGFKQYQNIKYSEWDRETLFRIVDEELCYAMLTIPPEMSKEDILELRNHGLKVKKGIKAGTSRSPVTTFGLAHMTSYDKYNLTNLNKLGLIMLTQIHSAHPSNYKEGYQVLSAKDWDNIPEPLITTEVFNPVKANAFNWKNTTKSSSVPW